MKLLPLPSLFKPKAWPLCTQHPKTSSFRITTMKDDIYKTINSMYYDLEGDSVETPDSWFTRSEESGVSTAQSPSEEYEDDSSMSISGESHLEEIVREAQQSSWSNRRLRFDPKDSDSPKIQIHTRGPFERSVAMDMDSEDPYGDFKTSMEEMVESLGMRDDWEGLEELLRWYLNVNEKETHGWIIKAFVDLLGGVMGRKSISSSTATATDALPPSFPKSMTQVDQNALVKGHHRRCRTFWERGGKSLDDDDDDDGGGGDIESTIYKSTASFSSVASFLSSAVTSSSDQFFVC